MVGTTNSPDVATPGTWWEGGEFPTGIGVGLVMNKTARGIVRVARVLEESPAQDAGIRVGDRLISINGVEITGADLNLVVASVSQMGVSQFVVDLRRGRESAKRLQVPARPLRQLIDADTAALAKIGIEAQYCKTCITCSNWVYGYAICGNRCRVQCAVA